MIGEALSAMRPMVSERIHCSLSQWDFSDPNSIVTCAPDAGNPDVVILASDANAVFQACQCKER
jgi:hypothetical protein